MSAAILSRRLMFAAAIVGTSVGCFGAASALTPLGPRQGVPVTPDGVVQPILEQRSIDNLLPVTSGQEPIVFAGNVSGAAAGAKSSVTGGEVRLGVNESGEYCVDLIVEQMTSRSCYSLDVVRTGIAVGAYDGPAGPVYVVGVAPDDAAFVRIAGHTVEVESNLWVYESTRDEDRSLVMSSADGMRTASLGG